MKTVSEFVAAGCELSSPLPIFIGILALSNGNPCKGCAYDNHGSKCAAKKKLFDQSVAVINAAPQETVSEMAARLGISKSEVRRQRRLT